MTSHARVPFRAFAIAACGIAFACLAVALLLLHTDAGARLADWLKPVSAVGGPFELMDQHGRTVRHTDLLGRPAAISFGYTTCPDVCPTTLNEMAEWREALGADASPVQFVFVSVDPERDTAEEIGRYVSYFDDGIIALTGTPAQVAEVVAAYRVYVRRVPDDDLGYLFDHSAGVYLMDASGHYRNSIDFGDNRESALRKLRELAAAS